MESLSLNGQSLVIAMMNCARSAVSKLRVRGIVVCLGLQHGWEAPCPRIRHVRNFRDYGVITVS
jgi:hypothetical protein